MSHYRYNRQVSPPAPFVYVSVCAAVEGTAAAGCPAQLDTAADLTVIPSRLVEELQLDQLSEFPILGVDGHLSTLPTFLVHRGKSGVGSSFLPEKMNRHRAKKARERGIVGSLKPFRWNPAGDNSVSVHHGTIRCQFIIIASLVGQFGVSGDNSVSVRGQFGVGKFGDNSVILVRGQFGVSSGDNSVSVRGQFGVSSGTIRCQFGDNSVSVRHYCFPCIKSVSWIHGKTSKTDRR